MRLAWRTCSTLVIQVLIVKHTGKPGKTGKTGERSKRFMNVLVDGPEATITRSAAGDEAGDGRAESCVLSHVGRFLKAGVSPKDELEVPNLTIAKSCAPGRRPDFEDRWQTLRGDNKWRREVDFYEPRQR